VPANPIQPGPPTAGGHLDPTDDVIWVDDWDHQPDPVVVEEPPSVSVFEQDLDEYGDGSGLGGNWVPEEIRRGARPLDQLQLHLGGSVGQPPSTRGPQAALRVAFGNDVRTLCPPTTGGSAAELLATVRLEANASCDNGVRPFPR
jgi:hypothetical protein